MILDIVQTKTNRDLEWVINEGKNHFAIAEAPFEIGKMNIYLTVNGSDTRKLYYNPHDKSYGSSLIDRATFRIFKENTLVGSIVGSAKKTGFLSGYEFYKISYMGNEYSGYLVGFGYKGLFLCLYKVEGNTERLISIVEKDLVVYNYRDMYKAYIENNEDATITLLTTLYWDTTNYSDLGKSTIRSTKTTIRNSINKEEISKYDATFIEKVKNKEEQI